MKEKNFINKEDINNYKKFALKEDMLKISIAFIMGNSFNKVVTGISDLLFMPFINLIIRQTGESWRRWSIVLADDLSIEVGKFLGIIIDFLLISIILYLLYGKLLSNIYNKKNNTKTCELCKSEINIDAIKCPRCTGDLNV